MAKNSNVGLSEYIGGIIILAGVTILVERLNWSMWLVAIAFLGIAGYIIWRRSR